MAGPWRTAQGAYLPFHLAPTSCQSRTLTRRLGSTAVDLFAASRWKGGSGRPWEGKITSPRLQPALPKPPPRAAAFLSDGRLGQGDDHQGLSILINDEPESTRGLKLGLPLHSNAQGVAAPRVVGPGERNALPLLRLAPRVFKMQMLFDSQVDEPARPCTLLVSTHIACFCATATDKVHTYMVIERPPSTEYGTWRLAGWQAGPPGPFGRPSWGWLIHGYTWA